MLPAAERAALLNRRSPTTFEAALAAFGLVVPWWACASALAAALFAAFEVLVAKTLPAFEATDLLVFSGIFNSPRKNSEPLLGRRCAHYPFSTLTQRVLKINAFIQYVGPIFDITPIYCGKLCYTCSVSNWWQRANIVMQLRFVGGHVNDGRACPPKLLLPAYAFERLAIRFLIPESTSVGVALCPVAVLRILHL